MRNRLSALLLAAVLALAATGCSTADAQIDRYNATLYVQGLLDETYTGAPAQSYLDLMDQTAQEAEETFQRNLESEYAQRLAVRFELEDQFISRALRQDFLDLLDQVYAHAQYQVKAATPLGDGRYCVEVSVTPVTFFSAAYADGYAALKADFQKDHTRPEGQAREKLTAAQARKADERYESAWAQAVYDYLYARLGAVTSGPAVTKLALVSPDAQGLYTLSVTDLQDIDDCILQY